jgi:cGMP-dependent protein kinase
VIVREGDPGNSFFLIKKGQVEISKEDKFIAKIAEGKYFGESVFNKEEVKRTATVKALTNVECLSIEK